MPIQVRSGEYAEAFAVRRNSKLHTPDTSRTGVHGRLQDGQDMRLPYNLTPARVSQRVTKLPAKREFPGYSHKNDV